MIVYIVQSPSIKKGGYSDCWGVYTYKSDAEKRQTDLKEGLGLVTEIHKQTLDEGIPSEGFNEK